MGRMSRRRLLELGVLSALGALAGNACPLAVPPRSPSRLKARRIRRRHAARRAAAGSVSRPARDTAGDGRGRAAQAVSDGRRPAGPGRGSGRLVQRLGQLRSAARHARLHTRPQLGQYISSLARAYAVTGDDATGKKCSGWSPASLPTITPRLYDGYPLPAYLFDKINIGLIDAHAFAADPQGAAGARRRARRGAAAPAGEGADAAADGGAAASQHRLHLGRVLHAAGESLSRLAARRRRSLSRACRALTCSMPTTSIRWRAARTCCRASTPTAT